MPDITSELLTKLWQNTRVPPPDKVAQIPKGGTKLDYVGHADVTDILLEHDPLWNWRPLTPEETPTGGPALERDDKGRPCGLWISLTVHGLSRPGYGTVNPTKEEAVKELIGDAIRNASMRFGVAVTLWSKAEREEPPASPTRTRAAKRATEGESAAAPPPAPSAGEETATPSPADQLAQDQRQLFADVQALRPQDLTVLKQEMETQGIPLDFTKHTPDHIAAVRTFITDKLEPF